MSVFLYDWFCPPTKCSIGQIHKKTCPRTVAKTLLSVCVSVLLIPFTDLSVAPTVRMYTYLGSWNTDSHSYPVQFSFRKHEPLVASQSTAGTSHHILHTLQARPLPRIIINTTKTVDTDGCSTDMTYNAYFIGNFGHNQKYHHALSCCVVRMSRVDMKVVLLGREYSGKTSVVERYLYDRFQGQVPYQAVRTFLMLDQINDCYYINYYL